MLYTVSHCESAQVTKNIKQGHTTMFAITTLLPFLAILLSKEAWFNVVLPHLSPKILVLKLETLNIVFDWRKAFTGLNSNLRLHTAKACMTT